MIANLKEKIRLAQQQSAHNKLVSELKRLRLQHELLKDKTSDQAVRLASRITEKYVMLTASKNKLMADNPKQKFK